jgi:hypothetical protein
MLNFIVSVHCSLVIPIKDDLYYYRREADMLLLYYSCVHYSFLFKFEYSDRLPYKEIRYFMRIQKITEKRYANYTANKQLLIYFLFYF